MALTELPDEPYPTGEGKDVEVVRFEKFESIARWSRDIIITEKIDGTNAQLFIHPETGDVLAASRNGWVTPERDNYGFARWVKEHEAELREGLGPGRHFGEWWGLGIQRGYGLREKRFSLFNVHRWHDSQAVSEGFSVVVGEKSQNCPAVCGVVPVLYFGPLDQSFDGGTVQTVMRTLEGHGSFAAPGYREEDYGRIKGPEGIVIYHTASRVSFKKTFQNDEKGKGQ